MGRLSTSLIGRPRTMAAPAASGDCVHGQSLPPKPEPMNRLTTRTRSRGSPNMSARTLRWFTTAWVLS